MRLKTKQAERNKHTDFVTSVSWNASNELFSCSDDFKVMKWDINGEHQGTEVEIETPMTGISWQPATRGVSEVFAVSMTDGSFKLVNKTGRVEKQVAEAHVGAITAINWSHDGSTLATSGEDGQVKVWARSGMLRTVLVQQGRPIYSVSWSPGSNKILFSSEKTLSIKPMQAGKTVSWKAHEGCVLACDWNPSNSLIISGGEDCKYKIWDDFGRNLFTSQAYDYVITSISWSPNGQLFAVGAYNMLKLCDKTGWTYSITKPETGSVMNLAWTVDGTICAGAGGNGAVVFGYIVDKQLSWQNIEVTLDEDNRMQVLDVIHEITEELDFRDRVINMSLGFEHLVVTTTAQCYIFNVNNWNAPHIFDIRESSSLIVQGKKYLALVDISNGIMVYNYEGRLMSNPKFSGLRVEHLNKGYLSISTDIVAVVDTSDIKKVNIFDLTSGKPLSNNLEHNLEILEIAANQVEHASDRKICILDSNRDLFLTSVHRPEMVKLCMMVDTMMWNDGSDMLCAIADGKLNVWYYPNSVYVDKDLLDMSKSSKDVSVEVGKSSVIDGFTGSQVTVRRIDGRISALTVSAYPSILYENCERGQWEKALKLCRFVKDPTLWACLAAMALHARELNSAEIALASIDEVDKVQFINYVKLIPSEPGRNAELAMFCKRPQEAEQILLQAKLYYRAIKMNIRLFQWDRALDLAVQQKTHIDTVLAYRQQYLERVGTTETIQKYKSLKDEVEIDWVTIKTKIRQDKEKEAVSGRPYEG